MPAFARYIGIDYPGAETATASLKGRRVYLAESDAPLVGGCTELSRRRTAQPKNPNDISARVRRQIPSPIRVKFEKYGFRTPNTRVKSTR